MCSGNSQAEDMRKAPGIKNGIVPAGPARSGRRDPEEQTAAGQAQQAEEADLAVAQLQRTFHHAAPGLRVEKRQHAFENQRQRQRDPDQVGPGEVHARYLRDGAGAFALPERIALKKSASGSSTITSDLLRKLARYASRLR